MRSSILNLTGRTSLFQVFREPSSGDWANISSVSRTKFGRLGEHFKCFANQAREIGWTFQVSRESSSGLSWGEHFKSRFRELVRVFTVDWPEKIGQHSWFLTDLCFTANLVQGIRRNATKRRLNVSKQGLLGTGQGGSRPGSRRRCRGGKRLNHSVRKPWANYWLTLRQMPKFCKVDPHLGRGIACDWGHDYWLDSSCLGEPGGYRANPGTDGPGLIPRCGSRSHNVSAATQK